MAAVDQPRATPSAVPPSLEGLKPNPVARSGPSLTRAVLPGMVARGHGIEALCSYLRLTRTLLFDAVVELGLPTPHERPLRKCGGRNSWSIPDTILFIVLWVAGWHAESLGQRFGRSPGSAWAKARQLGLPRRDRKSIFRPVHPGEALPPGVMQGPRANPGPTSKTQRNYVGTDATKPTLGQLLPTVPVLARDVSTPGAAVTLRYPAPGFDDLFGPTPVGTPPLRRTKGREIYWTRERDIELGKRWWARQHYKAIARDMGISPSTVQSRRFRLGLPTFHDLKDLFIFRREELVDNFDPSVVDLHISAASYVERKCSRYAGIGKEFWFWCLNTTNTKLVTSQEWTRLEKRQRERPSTARPKSHPPTLPYASHAF